jgi:1,4-alpha-glucan branching enzyme
MTLVGRARLAPVEPVASVVPTAPVAPVVQFVVVIPDAHDVSLVGDFNDWDESATPMAPRGADGIWSVTVPLAPGRYQYSFLVDGVTWVADPAAPRALEDDFGRPNSVVTVGGS